MGEQRLTSETRLRALGKRVTNQRMLVLDILANADGHLDASEIYARARVREPRLSLATVYRALNALRESGLVRQMHLAGERLYFELDRKDRHAHLVCSTCGRVWEVDSEALSKAARDAGREIGFQVSAARLEVIGLCEECRRTKGPQA
ncbi:MAG: Peroxide operon regulator [Chloroflexi bacterium ADurb.Bin180]|nr:MAG: Peroxide operon regulator [Chloroflexi bacterium ADurb.Bin180]HNR95556.1 transcriptional repressor [Anaerolineae bacterium]HNT05471.1 transcriptional repressor [Anaerolineae bacterium]HOU24695.1 transcriptional repressor [Anaerolineae bacterium]HQJ52101.1 transcriptional repressor [Anaerolineae bacterium]